MTTDLTGAALLSQRHGAPIWLIERSAAARAKASQSTVESVLAEWVRRVASPQTPDASTEEAASYQLPATSPRTEPPIGADSSSSPSGGGADEGGGGGQTLTGAALLAAVAEARGMPESIIERSANARASAAGVSLDDVLHEWAEEEGLEAPSDQLPAASKTPTTKSAPLPTPVPKKKPAAPIAAGLTGAALLTAVAEARGMPESLVERSANARAKKTDGTVDDVLNEWAGEAGLVAASDQPPAASTTTETAPSSSSPSGGGAAEGGGGGQALTGAALLTAVAEARGMPESLVERSAKARAKKTDSSVEDVLNEWAAEAGLVAASDQPPAASTTTAPAASGLTGAALLTAVAEARGMPESLVERSANARAKKTDTSLEDVLNEWAAEAGLSDASPQTPDASPTTAPAASGLTGAALLTAVAEARGMPESLVERSAKARAKKTDTSLEDVLNEWAGEAGLSDASPQTPDASPTIAPAAGALAGAALLTAVAEARGMPESLVERSAKARAKKTDTSLEDVLNEWAAEAGLVAASDQPPAAGPAAEVAVAEEAQEDSQAPDEVAEPAPTQARSWRHAVAIGAITALVPLVILVALAVFVDVPSDLTEAPWYLVGLDPFLTYLEPFIALVIIPGVVLASGVVLAVVAWNPKVHPSTRRLALLVLVFLILTVGALTIVGAIQT